ncbi:MAG: hypothetical protein Fur009_7970 [Candidatus Microgenomates bacterium]
MSKERLIIPDIKFILPGEYGFTTDGVTPIGTFAVGGGKNGCRGYLVYDTENGFAGLAHVDFKELDEKTIVNMISYLKSLGCKI